MIEVSFLTIKQSKDGLLFLVTYLVPESVEHDGVETDNQYEGQEVAENKETSLMDYHGWLLSISLVGC